MIRKTFEIGGLVLLSVLGSLIVFIATVIIGWFGDLIFKFKIFTEFLYFGLYVLIIFLIIFRGLRCIKK